MTYKQYLDLCAQTHKRYPEWRTGQAYFNALWQVNPNLAAHIQGSDLDPFYDDSRVTLFLDIIFGYYKSFGSVTDERRSNI